MFRAVRFICLGLLLILSAGCNSSGDSPEASVGTPEQQPNEIALCEWLAINLSDGPCGASAWRDLAAWRAPERKVESDYLYFGGHADAVQEARDQTEKGFQATGRPDLPRWPVTLPLAWDANPYNDNNWAFQLNAWRLIDPLILAWLETHDARYMQQVLAIVESWYTFHIRNKQRALYSWNDMATGVRAMRLAFLLDRGLRGEYALDERQHALLMELAQLHAQKLRREAFLTLNNHGIFQMHGLVALCTTVPYLKSCSSALSYAKGKIDILVGLLFSSEGVSMEHSPSYHFFGVSVINNLLLRSGWYKDFDNLQALIRVALANRIWMVMPDHGIVQVGDSLGAQSVRFPAGDPSCSGAGAYESRCYMLKAFPATGYGIVRSNWATPKEAASMLFFMAAFHSTSHKHADDLSFELFEFGEPFLTDSGEYSYNTDAWRDFVKSTQAHNALTINGASNSLRPEDAYGSALKGVMRHGDAFVIDGELLHPGSGALQRRRIFYKPKSWMLVIDQLSGGTVTTATQWFHFASQVQVTGPMLSADAYPMFKARLGGGREVQVEQILPACPGTLAIGSTEPLQGWFTREITRMEPRYTVGFTCAKVASAQATMFVLDPANRQPAMDEVGAILRELGLRP